MSNTFRPEDVHLANYMAALRRRWWVIVLVTLIGTLGAVGYYQVAHKLYSSTASVYVAATAGTANQVAGARTSGAVNLDTEAQVVTSVAVATDALKLMHGSPDTVPTLITKVSVTIPASSQVLSISCLQDSSTAAATCAQSFAQAFLAYTTATTKTSLNTQISALEAKISALQATSAKQDVEIASLPANSPQRAAADQQLTSDNNQLNSLNSQVAQLNGQLADASGGYIISAATVSTKPASPKALLVIASGVLAGLLVGLILAFLIDRRDRRIHAEREVTELDVPVLMSLPLKKKLAPELAIASSRSRVGQEFSELAHIISGTLGAGSHVIVVAGASEGRGAGFVAANLAVALSRNQPDVTLLCANLEESVIPDMVGLPPAPGLTDLLAGSLPIGHAGRRPAATPRLQVIAPGSAAGADAPDLQQDIVDQLLAGLRERARWVVVEAPPAAWGPDIYALAHAADAVLLVAEVRRTRTDALTGAVSNMVKTGTTVLGAVLLPSPKPLTARGAPAAGPPSRGRAEQAVSRASASGNGVIEWSAPDEAPTSTHRS